MNIVQQEGQMIRHTLILFQDFQTKKTESLKKKVEEIKATLPVTPFANAIVETLKRNRILLIAGDTGMLPVFV
jgi:HrpA-like RNA helicase